jgi:hypothetical protein
MKAKTKHTIAVTVLLIGLASTLGGLIAYAYAESQLDYYTWMSGQNWQNYPHETDVHNYLHAHLNEFQTVKTIGGIAAGVGFNIAIVSGYLSYTTYKSKKKEEDSLSQPSLSPF